MKYFLLLFISCFYCLNTGAQNLVPNGSFEQHYSCPDNTSEVDSIIGWFDVLNTPDYFDSCATVSYVSVPNNVCGSQTAFQGKAYIGLYTYLYYNYYREVVGAKLIEVLIPGNTYSISMRVSRGTWTNMALNIVASNNIGIRFTTYSLPLHTNITNNDEANYINNNPQLNEDSIVTDSTGWSLLHWNFKADSSYRYFYIGNFFDDRHTDTLIIYPNGKFGNAYYFIDSVNVYCTSSECFNSISKVSNDDILLQYDFSSKVFSIKTDEANPGTMIITNLLGQTIKEFRIESSTEINLSNLLSGYYTVIFNTKTQTKTKKIIIN